MASASRNARLIYTAESLARDTFGSCEMTMALQKEFAAFAKLANRQFETLKAALANWRERVQCGDVEFTSELEEDFKVALRASVSFLSFLIETFGDHYRGGHLLMNPKRGVSLMESQRKEAERILTSWKSPEWATLNERTVEWNKKQTSHLRTRLGSCN